MPDQQNDPWVDVASPISASPGNDPWAGLASEQISPAKGGTQNVEGGQQSGLQMPEMFQDKPDTTYGSIVPLARNEKTGETSVALPETLRSVGRGVVGLMRRGAGEYPPQTDTSDGGPNAPANPDEMGALTMLSPMSAAKGAPSVIGSVADSAAENITPSKIGQFLGDTRTINSTDSLPTKVSLAAQPTRAQIRNISGRTFDAADEAGGALPPSQHNELINAVSEQAEQAPEEETWFGASPLAKMAENAETLRDTPLSFKGATKIDKNLTGLIQKERTMDGTYTPLGQQYIAIQDTLHDLMARPMDAELPTSVDVNGYPLQQKGFELQNQGKQLWSAQAQMGRLQRMVQSASQMSNPAISLQVKARQAVDGKLFSTFQPQTQAVLQKAAANPGFAGELVRMGASRLPAMVSLGKGPLQGAATSVGSTAIRNLQERWAFRPLEKEIDRIGSSVDLPKLDKSYQAAGGRIKPKPHSGKVIKKPVSYPALEKMRQRP